MTERNCVNCQHWWWDSGSLAYSDMTPGTDWESNCRKQHWYMAGHDVMEWQFRDNMNKARTCPDYLARPDSADGGRG